jgi:hypothetical protein
MRISELNGWQRLWLLMSVIYLLFVLVIGYTNFPTANNTLLADNEILKNLSDKTLLMLAAEGETTGSFVSNIKEKFVLPTGQEIYLSTKFNSKDKDNLYKDYEIAIANIVNKKRIVFLLYMLAFWVIPCLSIYAIGLSFRWVYRGFKKSKND